MPTVILTSATLSAGGRDGFNHLCRRVGLAEARALQLGSPFDYRKQVELHLFRHMPDPSTMPDAFEEAVLAKIQEYVLRTRGRAFRAVHELSNHAAGGAAAPRLVRG